MQKFSCILFGALVALSGCSKQHLSSAENNEYQKWLDSSEEVSEGRIFYDAITDDGVVAELPDRQADMVLWFKTNEAEPNQRSLNELASLLQSVSDNATIYLQSTAYGSENSAIAIQQSRYDSVRSHIKYLSPNNLVYPIEYNPKEKGRRVLLWIDDSQSIGLVN